MQTTDISDHVVVPTKTYIPELPKGTIVLNATMANCDFDTSVSENLTPLAWESGASLSRETMEAGRER